VTIIFKNGMPDITNFVFKMRSKVTGVPADSLHGMLGQRVTLSGVAEPRLAGAAVRGDGFDVWVADLQDWPQGYSGHPVRVTGILEERYDLPVFVQRSNEPLVHGIAVPEGTDLHEASRRYVLRDAKWTLIQ